MSAFELELWLIAPQVECNYSPLTGMVARLLRYYSVNTVVVTVVTETDISKFIS